MNTHKQLQCAIIQSTNPCFDSYHTWIRTPEDILTFEEAWEEEPEGSDPDFTREDAENAIKTGRVVVYSSKEIRQGAFVTPSYMEALAYCGDKNMIHSKEVALTDVAWIDTSQGQYAKVE